MDKLTLFLVVVYNGITVESTPFAIFNGASLFQAEGDRVCRLFIVFLLCLPVHGFC